MKTEANVKTQFLSAETVAHLVSTLGIAACLRGVADYLHADYLRWEAFDKSARVASHSADGVIELMPISDGAHYTFKYVNGHPKNTAFGLPTVMAFGVLARVDTGTPEVLSELTLTTAIRTAAMSALAAKVLARPDSRRMALIGNGAQSEFQALAFHHLLGIEEIRLFDIDRAATAKLMRNLAHTDLRLRVCASVQEAVRGADIVTTVTADKASARIITADMLEPGMHINGVGGDCPGKTEMHPDVLNGALVFVEYEPQTRVEGDLQQIGRLSGDRALVRVRRQGTGPHRRAAGDLVRLGRFCTGGLLGPALHARLGTSPWPRPDDLADSNDGQPQGSVQSRSSIGGGERRRNEDEPRRLNGIGPEGRVPRKRSSTLRVSAHRLYAIGKVGLR